MNGNQVWRKNKRGGMSERIEDYCIGISFLCDLCLQPKSGEKNG